MYVLDEVFGRRLLLTAVCWVCRGCGVYRGFIVEAVEIAAGVLERLNPFLGLIRTPLAKLKLTRPFALQSSTLPYFAWESLRCFVTHGRNIHLVNGYKRTSAIII